MADYKFLCPALLLPALCAFVLLNGHDGVSAQTGPQSNYELLTAKAELFLGYQRDFLDFERSETRDVIEHETAEHLYIEASETYDRLAVAALFLELYDGLSCREDQTKVAPKIERKFRYFGQMTGNAIQHANLEIADTHKPGVAAEAIRMRDELREIQAILDSTKLQ